MKLENTTFWMTTITNKEMKDKIIIYSIALDVAATAYHKKYIKEPTATFKHKFKFRHPIVPFMVKHVRQMMMYIIQSFTC